MLEYLSFPAKKKEGIIWFEEYLTHFEDVSYKTDIPNYLTYTYVASAV